MKTKIKTIAAAILGLITLSVDAQGIGNRISGISANETLLAMKTENSNFSDSKAEMDGKAKTTGLAFSIQPVTEESLQLESWMIKENNFEVSTGIELATDEPVQLESWMTDEKLFEVTSMSIQAEQENCLELENWMLSEELFEVRKPFSISTKTFVFSNITDTPLQLESWMLNTAYFRK